MKLKLPVGIGDQGPMTWVKKAKTYPCYDVTHKKSQI